jgi:hypothetical protein
MAVVVEVEIGSKKALGSLNDLKSAATQLEDKLSQTEFGTAEFGRLANQLKGVRSQLKDFDLQLEGLDKEQRATALVDTFSGLTGAVGAVSSAFLAFGANSAAIEDAEKKLLGVIGVVSGLRDASNGLVAAGKLFGSTFDKLGDTLKAGFQAGATGAQTFKAALLATGIGAAITAVGFLVANFDELTGVTEEEAKATKKAAAERKAANEELKRQNEFIGKESSEFVTLITRLKETNAGSKERSSLIKQINTEYGTTLKNLSDEEAFQASLNNEIKNYIEFQRQKYTLQKNDELIQKNLAKQEESRTKLAKARQEAQDLVDAGVRKSVEDALSYREDLRIIIKREEEELAKAEKRLLSYGGAANEASNKVNELTNNGKKFVKQTDNTKTSTDKVTDALAKQREELQAKLDLDLAANEAAKQAALVAAKTADERITIERDFTQKAITLREKFTNDIFNATKKEEQNKTQLNADLKNLDNERIAAETEANNELEALADQRTEALKTREEAFLALSSQLGQEAATNVLNAIQNQIDAVETTTIEGVEKLRQLQAQLIEQERAKALAANEQAKTDRLTALQSQLDAELELYVGNEAKIAELRALYTTQAEAVTQQAADNIVDINETANAKIVANDKETAEQKTAIQKASFDAIVAFANTTINALDGLAEEGTKAQKAVEISKILISAATSAFQAFAQATALIPPPAGQIVGAALAAVIGAGAAKAIANVNKVQVGGGGGGTGNLGVTGGGGTGGGGNTPFINAPGFGLGGSNQPLPTFGGMTQGAVGDTGGIVKAYVLAGDVTSAQAANAKLQQRRTL